MSDEPREPRASAHEHRGLRRVGGGVLAVALGLGAVVLLLLFLNSRDEAGVEHGAATSAAAAAGPGVAFDGADGLLDAPQLRLLEAGDVFLLYDAARPPRALRALQQTLSGPPDPALEEAGQAVILQRSRGTDGVVALAWRRRLDAQDPADPQLEAFASHWLGRGGG